ncbi:DUF2087 domain-containing protein [Streptomyces sp. NPDC059076]|uniref:DUF2087 domain-containing protein n=1 Tax=unclassified Streptomyces TaxID=2593676 RepID=UPI00369883B6
MAVDQLAGLLAEQTRARAFAAVALGANTPGAVTAMTELTPKQALTALRRLQDRGLIVSDDEGLRIDYERLRALARPQDAPRKTGENPSKGDVPNDQPVTSAIGAFVRDGRLTRLPAQWQRKKLVLAFVADRTFQVGVDYSEQEVNDRLRTWCEGGQLDHVTLRRYLVDLHHLHRRNGVYWVPAT